MVESIWHNLVTTVETVTSGRAAGTATVGLIWQAQAQSAE
jgi:hypothetical protein